MKLQADPEPEFLLQFDTAETKRRWHRSGALSVMAHAAVLVVLLNVEFQATPPKPVMVQDLRTARVTPLVAPPPAVIREMTQKAPNNDAPAKNIDLEGLTARPQLKPSPPRPAVSPKPNPGIQAAPQLPSAPVIEAAPAQVAQLPPAGTGLTNLPPPPAPPPEQKPKISFETVPSNTGRGAGNVAGTPNVNIPLPRGTVDEAVSAAVRNRGAGGMVVGDEVDLPPGAAQSLSQMASPGRMGSQLELLSDPQGADFRPYLIKVLSSVRRNWFAVIPESARLGRRGRVLIQFSISRDGRVPKLVIATPSGAEPLDRAAVAGISASNPFPPLPSDFKGDQIRLQLSFVYNAPR